MKIILIRPIFNPAAKTIFAISTTLLHVPYF